MSQRQRDFQLRRILKEKEILDDLQGRAQGGRLRMAAEVGVTGDMIEEAVSPQRRSALEALPGAPTAPSAPAVAPGLEAIVREFGRPSLLVRDGTFEVPEASLWRRVLLTHRTPIERAISSVGRIELLHHLDFDWVGTGWVIEPGVVITNRHVAEVFARKTSNDRFLFVNNLFGDTVEAKIDFLEEYEREGAAEIKIRDVLFLAEGEEPDIALLRVEDGPALPPPLELSDRALEIEDLVGVIGYPAFDTRNGIDPMRRYFKDVYDVKRFAPGKVSSARDGSPFFESDYTSLGGNSGSAVIDLTDGSVVGLHFAGRFKEANFAVKVPEIKEAMASVSIQVPVDRGRTPASSTGVGSETPEADGIYPPEHYDGRDGYVEEFLGPDAHSVSLPGLAGWAQDVAEVIGAPADQPGLARYRHFSVVLSKARRLPIFTAVNIDGNSLRRVPRTPKWYLDGRINPDHQAGNELYRNNDLDRGHMVRRLDPVWGDIDTAKEANDDSFHYTNAAPQHKHLNQRDWAELESTILDQADVKDSRMSAMTGPVLRDNDLLYRGLGLPREFWKVVVMVNGTSGRLSALGFVLSHSHLVRSLEETVLDPGDLKVYQVPIREIEEMTRLDLSHLKEADVLTPRLEGLEGVGRARWEIREVTDIVLS